MKIIPYSFFKKMDVVKKLLCAIFSIICGLGFFLTLLQQISPESWLLRAQKEEEEKVREMNCCDKIEITWLSLAA